MISDNKIISHALYYYAQMRHEFASAIAQKSYIKRDGTTPTLDDIHEAFNIARRCDELVGKFRAQVEKEND